MKKTRGQALEQRGPQGDLSSLQHNSQRPVIRTSAICQARAAPVSGTGVSRENSPKHLPLIEGLGRKSFCATVTGSPPDVTEIHGQALVFLLPNVFLHALVLETSRM